MRVGEGAGRPDPLRISSEAVQGRIAGSMPA